MVQCCAIKKDGNQCAINILDENVRCGTHRRVVNEKGLNAVRRTELKHKHEKKMTDINSIMRVQAAAVVNNRTAVTLIELERKRLLDVELIRYQQELLELNERITQELVANNMVDPDFEILERVRARHQARVEANRRAYQEWLERERQRPVINRQVAVQRPQLAIIAADNQNVHRAQIVEKVKKTIDIVLKIPVPPEYETHTLKTSGEIILQCKLTKRAAWQMMSKYCQEEDIYDLGPGIYSKVLNSVWQYIINSPNAEDLKKILSVEMEDNIGMCAQGNLSRLCNILSGYIDEINTETKSTSEILGERFSALLDIQNDTERMERAREILVELNVPEQDRQVWLDPLMPPPLEA
jgi:hypothetical protein